VDKTEAEWKKQTPNKLDKLEEYLHDG